MLLRLRDVCVHYGKVEAVSNVSLEVGEGAITCLLGTNGAGKSTTLRTISGIKKPISGQISYQDEVISGASPSEILRRGVAHVPEGRNLFPYMSVFENLQMGAYIRHNKKEIEMDIEEIFKHFPILKMRRRQTAGSLSGGEQQMLAIARALMAKPKLLLMDEPVQGLAPLIIGEVEKVIRGLHDRGITILLVEHNLHIALGLAHKVYILESGKVILEGDPKTLSQTEYVQKIYLL
jgi:branched-chain amino acid transport system ATP-binding protein